MFGHRTHRPPVTGGTGAVEKRRGTLDKIRNLLQGLWNWVRVRITGNVLLVIIDTAALVVTVMMWAPWR